MSHYCKTCDTYMLPSRNHVCPPKWEVSDPEYGGGWTTIYALNASQAAEEFCKQDDVASADYTYVRNGGADKILVRPFGSEEIEEFQVCAESVPEYSARRIQ